MLPSVFEHYLQAVHHGGYGRHSIPPPTQERWEEEGLQTLHNHSQELEKQALEEGGGWGRGGGHRITIMLHIPPYLQPHPHPTSSWKECWTCSIVTRRSGGFQSTSSNTSRLSTILVAISSGREG